MTGHIFDGAAEILQGDLNRLDDLARAHGLQPDRAFVGMRMRGVEFVGTPERPIDLRGWDLSRCDLTGATFSHVIVDETTLLEDADLTDITGMDRDAILALAQPAPPFP